MPDLKKFPPGVPENGTDGRPSRNPDASGHADVEAIKTPQERVCHCFHGEINIARRLSELLLDHITEDTTGAAALHKGKGHTSSTEGHDQKKKRSTYKRRERARGRQVGGRETQLFHLSLSLCVSSPSVSAAHSQLALSLCIYLFLSLSV